MPKAGIIEDGLSKGNIGIKLNKGDKIILPSKELLPELYIAGGFFSNDEINIQLTEFVIEGKNKSKKIKNKREDTNASENSNDSNDNKKPASLPPQETTKVNTENTNTQKKLMASLKKKMNEQNSITEEQPDNYYELIQDEVNSLLMQNNGNFTDIYGIKEKDDDVEQDEDDSQEEEEVRY